MGDGNEPDFSRLPTLDVSHPALPPIPLHRVVSPRHTVIPPPSSENQQRLVAFSSAISGGTLSRGGPE